MLCEYIAAIAPGPTPETIKSSITYSAVDPIVIYGQMVGNVVTAIVAALGVWASYVNKKKIQEVHVLVNSQFQEYKDSVARILVLEKDKSRLSGKQDAEREHSG